VTDTPAPIRNRDRDTIIQALAAGVVPRNGLRHIQVGRASEVGALIRDIDRISDEGAAIRFIIGEYGAGKTFFLNLVRLIALERKLVTIHADLAPDRRLLGRDGQARGLYAESVLERFLTDAVREAESSRSAVETLIDAKLAPLQQEVGGYDYSVVLKAYLRGSDQGDEELKTAALRWIRGDYSTKTEARMALGVRNIIDDTNVYDALKLLASFVRLAGYNGLLVVLDEMVNLYKLQNTQSRNQNFEQILRIINDTLQGNVRSLGFVFGGTPEFLLDSRRGLYSYQALESRLAENSFAKGGLVDMSGPVIRLQCLSPEDLLILLSNIRHVVSGGDVSKYLVPDDALLAFMAHCSQRIGEAYFRTPRNTIKAFVNLLAVLEQNPGANWKELLGSAEIARDDAAPAGDNPEEGGRDDLANLRL